MLKTLCYVTRQVRGKGQKEGRGGGKKQAEREIENRGGRQRSRERSEAFSSIRGSIAAQLARRGCVTVAASVCLRLRLRLPNFLLQTRENQVMFSLLQSNGICNAFLLFPSLPLLPQLEPELSDSVRERVATLNPSAALPARGMSFCVWRPLAPLPALANLV